MFFVVANFENSRFSFLLMLPCGRTISLFVDVALQAASILKNLELLYLFNFLDVAKLGSMLEMLV